MLGNDQGPFFPHRAKTPECPSPELGAAPRSGTPPLEKNFLPARPGASWCLLLVREIWAVWGKHIVAQELPRQESWDLRWGKKGKVDRDGAAARGEQKHQESVRHGHRVLHPDGHRDRVWLIKTPNSPAQIHLHPPRGHLKPKHLGTTDKGAQAWAAALLVGTEVRACNQLPAEAGTVQGWIRL